jgi:hypothetical protein
MQRKDCKESLFFCLLNSSIHLPLLLLLCALYEARNGMNLEFFLTDAIVSWRSAFCILAYWMEGK